MGVRPDTARQSPNADIKELAERLSQTPSYMLWIIGMLVWICWCLIPDFLSLLKTRIVLVVIKFTAPGLGSLVVTLLIDLIIGIWAFVASFTLLQALLAAYFIPNPKTVSGDLDTFLGTGYILWVFIFAFEAWVLYATKLLFIANPIANLFWASMIPSAWLWGYILASVLTRSLLASRPLLKQTVHFLDVDNHPVRSIGIVAGLLAGLITALGLVAVTIL
jgi:hypothetical protein